MASSRPRKRNASMLRWWWQPAAKTMQIPAGMAWMALLVLALWAGLWPFAIVVGIVGGVAAFELADGWSEHVDGADAPLAALIAGFCAPAAAVHTAAVGALFVAGVVVTVLGASVQRRSESLMPQVGATLQSWLPIGLATASAVIVYRYEVGAAVWLICLVGIYDAGHYLVGAGAPHPWEGPIAGAFGVAVVAFALVTVGVPPLDASAGLRFGAVAMVALPLGVIATSALAPTAQIRAPMLRRIDSWLVFAPLWAWAIGRYLDGFV
jgi:hypothetical protein